MKRKILAWILILVLVLAAGCAGEVPDITLQTTPTVPDVFTKPTEESTKSTVSGETEPSETTAPTKPHSLGGSMSFGPAEENPRNEEGFLFYEGGEMRMTFEISASGNMTEHGTGFLLFVDGRLQPYKTEDDDTYRYMHVFYPEDGVDLVKDMIFVPVTGEAGDVLEIWYARIYWPEYSLLEDGAAGIVLSTHSTAAGTRLELGATPPELELPEVSDRMISSQISYVDLKPSEISGWTEQDLQEKCEFRMYVNGSASRYIFGISEEPVKLRFEVWGNPYVHYGLIFFVDNQPISVAPKDLQFFGVNSGQKTVIEAELDMTGFDGESFVYAALIPRNKRSIDNLTDSWLEMYRYVTLYDVSPFEDYPENG